MNARKASELVKEFASGEPGQFSTFNRLRLRKDPDAKEFIMEDGNYIKLLTTFNHSDSFNCLCSLTEMHFILLNDLFAQVLAECNDHLLYLQPLMRKIQENENKLNERRRLDDDMGISEDERSKSEAEKTLIQNALKSDQFGALVHHLSLVRNKRCLMAYVYNRAEIIRSLGWMGDSVLPEELQDKLDITEKEYFKNHAATLQSYISELDLNLTVDIVPPKDPYIKVRVLDDIGEIVLGDQVVNVAPHAIMFLRRSDAEQYITQGRMEELTG